MGRGRGGRVAPANAHRRRAASPSDGKSTTAKVCVLSKGELVLVEGETGTVVRRVVEGGMDVADLAGTIQEAFYIATTGRPGPVVLVLPEDMLIKSTDARPMPRVEPVTSSGTRRRNVCVALRSASATAASSAR